MHETRKLPGCISFVLSADLEDPGLLHVFQEWESPAAFREQLVGLGVREIAVQRYAIGSVGPIA